MTSTLATPQGPLAIGLVALLILLQSPVLAAPGDLDASFDPASGVNGNIYCVTAQADGKIIIGGEFSEVRGAARSGIARLNSDGTADRSFDPGSGVGSFGLKPRFTATKIVYATVLQSDGRLLIGGRFKTVGGISRNCVARLNTDGSLDTSFNPGIGTNDTVYSVGVQNDGKVLIGGSFTNIGGVSRSHIARLNMDGSVDNSFDPGVVTGVQFPCIYATAIQSDGKLLVSGYFTSVNGTTRNSIARLNADGSLDTTFDPGTGTGVDFLYSTVRSIALQPDGKVLLAGNFTSINGMIRNRVARLNSDGSLDDSFDPGLGPQGDGVLFNLAVTSVALLLDGKVLIGGQFVSVNGANRNHIARLNSDGSLDDTFDPGAGANGDVSSVALQADGKVLLGGSFFTINGTNRDYLGRLHGDGTLDNTFKPATETGALAPDVSSIALQPDGKILLGLADFFVDSYPGSDAVTLERLNADGSWDNTFTPTSTGTNGAVYSATLQPDGKVLIGGIFSSVNGTNRNCIARLNGDGTLDATFDPGAGANFPVNCVAVQPNGKVLLGGRFGAVNGTSRIRIARLNTDGSVDASFDPAAGPNDDVVAILLQPDGKVLVGGNFTSINGIDRRGIGRLNTDGSLDGTFDPGAGPNSTVKAIALQTDGKVLVGGGFTTIGAVGRRYIARLDAQGALDNTFTPGPWASVGVFSRYVRSIALQSDGKMLVGGSFSVTNGTSANNLARLNSDGSLDYTFGPCAVAGGNSGSDVFCVAVQPDGKPVIGGSIGTVNGVTRQRVARLLGDAAVLVFGPVMDQGEFVVHYKGTPGLTYTLERSASFSPANWQKEINRVAPATDTGLGVGVFELRVAVIPSGQSFYRAVYPAY